MQDEKSMTGNALVPTDVLAVLEQEVFIGMAIVIHDVGVATILQGLHALNRHGVGQHNRLEPTCHPTLIARIAGRAIAVAIIATRVHQVPIAHALTTAIVGVVEVGIAQAMTELVTHRANTVDVTRLSVEFSATSVGVDAHAIELE